MSEPTDEQLREAIEVVAAEAIRRKITFGTGPDIDWGDFPDIGESDWDYVFDHAGTLIDRIASHTAAEYEAAYALLAARSTPHPEEVQARANTEQTQPRGEAAYLLEGDDEIFTEVSDG